MKKNIKIGDYVIVKSSEECASAEQDVIHFVPEMKPFCGKKLKVTNFDFKSGWLELEGCEWMWSEDMVTTREELEKQEEHGAED